MTRDLTGPGTAEARWRDSAFLAALPRVAPADVRPSGRAVVVAPHPDDETLGAGGTLAAWASGAEPLDLVVVAVTDGEASHPDSPTLGREELAVRRDEERRRALAALGLDDAAPGDAAPGDVTPADAAPRRSTVTVVRAGLPDGGVAGHRGALTEVLDDVLHPGDTVLAPVTGDGHPDHDVVAEVAADAADRHGVALWRYAIWLWHWADPLTTDDAGTPAVPHDDAVAVTLPEAALRAKQDAVACFTTQVQPLSADPRDASILPPEVLARLLRDVEVLWRTGP
ncbi:PIG-L deacetylase family protein [Actinomycetospora sp. TBRC 11914]|uniref:PIG-L deacetylase family protein n=1 Tax=Actinomycetospora sp. TBRC 11914 TaxID=2729387 RepID=UPI00145C4E87|nr:PIG-L family deacetylase [Actinomycetospora sp. TBRC 11914]NMO88501.1 PIG-L family deacetylase [Actinomycetospora sp. TBRC 11914]